MKVKRSMKCMPKFNAPHWISGAAAVLAAVCLSLASSTSPLLAPYDASFKVIAAVCALLAAPNYAKKDEPHEPPQPTA